ncbi:glycogen-binding domain-containing protein, partial [bacterium]|nr:glycogen-binding domain-containing protein [bacterium]
MPRTAQRILPSLLLALVACGAAQAAEVTFRHEAPGAAAVYLAGEFNNWSDSADPMSGQDGVWTLTRDLAPGTYQYKFVVDGNWVPDANNGATADDGFGGQNSVLTVKDGDTALAAAAAGAAGGLAGAAAPAP